MTKEQLTALGLADEQAQAVAEASVAELDGYVPKADYNALETAKSTLQTQYDSAIADKETLQTKLDEACLNHELERALAQNGVQKMDMVKRLLDADKLEFDEKEGFKGLDAQLESIRKEAPSLFHAQADKKPPINTGSDGIFRRQTLPADKGPGIGERLGKQTAEPSADNPYFK